MDFNASTNIDLILSINIFHSFLHSYIASYLFAKWYFIYILVIVIMEVTRNIP